MATLAIRTLMPFLLPFFSSITSSDIALLRLTFIVSFEPSIVSTPFLMSRALRRRHASPPFDSPLLSPGSNCPCMCRATGLSQCSTSFHSTPFQSILFESSLDDHFELVTRDPHTGGSSLRPLTQHCSERSFVTQCTTGSFTKSAKK